MSGIVGKNPSRGSGVVGATPVADESIDSDSYVDGSIDNAHIADDAIDSEHYAAGSIDEAHIADNAVTLAKMAGGTDGNIISYDASGDPVAIATGNDGQVLTSAGAGAPPVFEDAGGGGRSTLIKTFTVSNDSTISMVHGTSSVVFDSTYKKYVVDFIDIKPATDKADFEFNGSIDAGSNYNVTKTTSYVRTSTEETGTNYFYIEASESLEQATGFQKLMTDLGGSADESGVGSITFWNPSNTTEVKHFQGDFTYYQGDNYTYSITLSGYFNTTSDIDAVQFKMSSGNIESGVIKLYGVT